MMLANQNAIESGGYVIERSLRFSAASNNYMSRTFGSGGNQQKWTWSAWVKIGGSTAANARGAYFLFGTLRTSNYTMIGLNPADAGHGYQFGIESVIGTAGGSCRLFTTRVLRDPSAWYHLVLAVDTTQAVAADRVKIYVNGVKEVITTIFTPAQNLSMYINESGLSHGQGAAYTTSYANHDGGLAEVRFVNAQQLSASDFGETNIETGEWVAKPYTGTYGTNGFYLDFEDGTSTTTLGYDAAGSNDWTLTNFTRSAGVNDCWMKDVPAGNGEASAVQPSGNYCVLNALYTNTQGVGTLANGNLRFSFGNATTQARVGNFSAKTGKWYFEVIISSNPVLVGIRQVNTNDRFSNSILYAGTSLSATGEKYVNGTASAFAGVSWAAGDLIGIAVNMDGGTVAFYKNNTLVGSINLSDASITDFVPAFNNGASTAMSGDVNFGQRSFAYTPPTGFKALCTSNLPTPAIPRGDAHFDTVLDTGANILTTSQALYTNELAWVKDRANANNHQLVDAVRGALALQSNTTSAESAYSAPSGNSVGWTWRASDSAPVSNTDGSITSSVSANVTAGFSIVEATLASSNQTIGHGLGKAPKLIIAFRTDNTSNRAVYHGANTSAPETDVMFLNLTNATADDNTYWNDTAPTSAVFSVGTVFNGDNIFYCFAEIEGFSKFGSYTGNGSADGKFEHTGSDGGFLMIKQSSAAGNPWIIIDRERETTNPNDTVLNPNTTAAESTGNASVDFVANGFKIRAADGSVNTNGATYIYAWFARNPFKYANAQ